MQPNNELTSRKNERKARFIKEIAPTLMKPITFPDSETIVEHTCVRANLLADRFDKDGYFDKDELTDYESYMLFCASHALASIASHDPATSVDTAMLRAKLLSDKIFGLASVPENQGSKVDLVSNDSNVKMTPNTQMTYHKSW